MFLALFSAIWIDLLGAYSQQINIVYCQTIYLLTVNTDNPSRLNIKNIETEKSIPQKHNFRKD
jgi:hypothetical protein